MTCVATAELPTIQRAGLHGIVRVSVERFAKCVTGRSLHHAGLLELHFLSCVSGSLQPVSHAAAAVCVELIMFLAVRTTPRGCWLALCNPQCFVQSNVRDVIGRKKSVSNKHLQQTVDLLRLTLLKTSDIPSIHLEGVRGV